MSGSRARRLVVLGLAAFVALAAGGLLAGRVALDRVRGQLAEALGPGSSIGAIRVGLHSLVIEDLRLPGGAGWPAEHALRAERIEIVPSLRTLLSGRIAIARITATRPALSALRTRDGRLRLLPTLTERTAAPAPAAAAAASVPTSVWIRKVEIEDGAVDVYDATIAKPPWKIVLADLSARVSNIVAPTLDTKMPFEIEATLKGRDRDGRIEAKGFFDGASGDSRITSTIRGGDLLAVAPYVLRASDLKLRHGGFDLDIASTVEKRRIHAPGRIVLSKLEFAREGGVESTILGMPRDAALAALSGRGDRIDVEFTIEGNVDDPKFSLNEAFATRMSVALAERLGVSVLGVAEGVEGIGRGALDRAGEAARGAGDALRRGWENLTK